MWNNYTSNSTDYFVYERKKLQKENSAEVKERSVLRRMIKFPQHFNKIWIEYVEIHLQVLKSASFKQLQTL